MQYKLYGHPLSPFSCLAMTSLIYKEVEHEFVFTDLASGAHKQADYLALNPFGLVPVLNCETFNIYESYAIFEYLEENFTNKPMLSAKEPSRSRTRALALCAITNIIPAARDLFLNALGRVQLSEEAKVISANALTDKLVIFEKEILSIDKQVEVTPYDAIFYQMWLNANIGLPSLRTDFPKLEQYWQELSQKPVFQKLEAEPAVKKVREFFKGLVSAKG